MSYILDALRKSESDRYQEKLPELGGAAPIWLRKKKKNAVWPWIIAIALLINAVVLAYLFWPRQPSAVQTDADNLTLAAPVQPVTPSVQAYTPLPMRCHRHPNPRKAGNAGIDRNQIRPATPV